MKTSILCALLVTALLSFPSFLEGGAGAFELAVGKPFPPLVLPSLEDGKPASVSDFRGQKLILHIWASW